jgi:hypothetical protein
MMKRIVWTSVIASALGLSSILVALFYGGSNSGVAVLALGLSAITAAVLSTREP